MLDAPDGEEGSNGKQENSVNGILVSEKALTETDETIVSLASTAKIFAKRLRAAFNKKTLVMDPVDAAKLLIALTDSALKLGRRAEEISVRAKRSVRNQSKEEIEQKIKELSTVPVVLKTIGHQQIVVQAYKPKVTEDDENYDN